MSSQIANQLSLELTDMKAYEETLKNMSREELELEMKRHNPYSGSVPEVEVGKDETVSISCTNLTMDYAMKLNLTAVIAYTFRAANDYMRPAEVPPIDIIKYLEDPTVADPPSTISDPRLINLYAKNKELMEKRVIIKEFLEHLFNFDVDRHVASSLSTNVKDTTRAIIDTMQVRAALTKRNTARTVEAAAYEAVVEDVEGLPTTLSSEIANTAFNHIPSRDVLFSINRYIADHYEELQKTVYDIHGCRPDTDMAFIVYDVHKNRVDAQKFRERAENQVAAPILNIDKNRWVMTGDYRQNREKIEFLNADTMLLKEMFDKREQDAKVGQDIMRRRVAAARRSNAREYGPIDPEVKDYFRENKSATANMISKPDDDCPDDAIETNVFNMSDGGLTMDTVKIFSEAVAPGDTKTTSEVADTVTTETVV